MTRTVTIRAGLPTAQRAKTQAHDLLTAPTTRTRGGSCGRRRRHAAGVRAFVRSTVPAAAVASSAERKGDAVESIDGTDGDRPRNVSTPVVPAVGGLEITEAMPGVIVTDAAGQPVLVISDYLNSLLVGGASPGSVRSYALLALLRWWRFLAAVNVRWERATRVEVRDLVLWIRFAARPATPLSRLDRANASALAHSAMLGRTRRRPRTRPLQRWVRRLRRRSTRTNLPATLATGAAPPLAAWPGAT
jgi:hypothetical protein